MRFEKVSFEQYYKDVCKDIDLLIMSNEQKEDLLKDVRNEWESIKLPQRAHYGDAGYDFFSNMSFVLDTGCTIKIPTGIRVILDEDKFLAIVPRSSCGFKYRLQLDNTVGTIDSNYSKSDNEGHIWIKMTNDSKHFNPMKIEKGQAIAQGIIMKYYTVDDDEVRVGDRNGGFGSSDNK